MDNLSLAPNAHFRSSSTPGASSSLTSDLSSGSTKALRLQRSLNSLETWGFGLTSHISWISTAPAIHAALGASAFWVWVPVVLVGVLLNFQVQQLGAQWLDTAGGTPNYATRLLKNYPRLGRYAAIGYFLGWAGYLPVNAIILTDLIKVHLDLLQIDCPTVLLRDGFTVLAFVVAFSGARSLAILHAFFAMIATGLLLLFCFEGLGWLALAPNSPGLLPPNWLGPSGALSFTDWAKWYFIAVYSVCGCETTSSYVADSRNPRRTLKFLNVAACLIPPIFWGGSWVLMRLATQPDLADNASLNLLAAASPFWGQSASLVVSFLIASSCLLGCATVVSNCPRILYQLSLDGYLAPIFGVASRRGVLGPALLLTLGVSLVALIWGDVVRIVMGTVTSYLIGIMAFHLGLWLQRGQPGVKWAGAALASLVIEAVVLVVGGLAWGWQNLLLGLLFPVAVLAVDVAIRRIRFAPFRPQWWIRRYSQSSHSRNHDFITLQVAVLVVLVCSSVAIGWFFGAKLSQASRASQDLLVILILVVAFVSVAIACWTSLPQVTSIAEAREQAEYLFRIASDAILVLSDQGIIRQVNPAAERLFNRPTQNLVEHPLVHLLNGLPANPTDWTSRSEQQLSHRPDSFVEVAVSDRYSQDFHEYVIILRDITERRQAEAALQASEARFRTMVANIPGIIYRCRCDADWSMEFVSDAIVDISGYPATDFIHNQIRTFASIFHPDDVERVETTVGQALMMQQPYRVEFRIIDRSGRLKWLYEKGQGIWNGNGQLLWLDGAIFDITERKQAEEKLHQALQLQEELTIKANDQTQQLEATLQSLKQAQSQLVQSEKMSGLGQLVAGIAHEINNPVNFIHGNLEFTQTYAQNLLQLVQLYQQAYPKPNPEIRKYIEEIDLNFLIDDFSRLLDSMQVGADRIQQIVLSLRNFSRLDEDGMKFANLHQGIDESLLILQHRFKANGMQAEILVVKHYDDLPLVPCHAGQLNQVFVNLLGNAVDALREYELTQQKQRFQDASHLGFTPRITISTQIKSDWVQISIQDNGPGMSEKTLARIFDPFFTTKPVGKGTGLGLSISYQVVTERHAGKLCCLSRLGEGTEFVIEIPVQAHV
jgi:PAS domain S-box-containing protein